MVTDCIAAINDLIKFNSIVLRPKITLKYVIKRHLKDSLFCFY